MPPEPRGAWRSEPQLRCHAPRPAARTWGCMSILGLTTSCCMTIILVFCAVFEYTAIHRGRELVMFYKSVQFISQFISAVLTVTPSLHAFSFWHISHGKFNFYIKVRSLLDSLLRIKSSLRDCISFFTARRVSVFLSAISHRRLKRPSWAK